MERNLVQEYIDGAINRREFNRLNISQILKARGQEIFSPESIDYLGTLIEADAPRLPIDVFVERQLAEINDQRDEILRAFIAKHGAQADDVEQFEIQDPTTGLHTWAIRKVGPTSIRPVPQEIIDALQASERALMGLNICGDPKCGSDLCDAYQKIIALLPDAQRVNINCSQASHLPKKEKKPAARPSMSHEQASLALDQAIAILDSHSWDESDDDAVKAGKVSDLVQGFRDRWFAFVEQYLQAIEDALPVPMDELGSSMPEAVATLTKRLDEAEREAEKYRDTLAQQEERRLGSPIIQSSNSQGKDIFSSLIGEEINIGPASVLRVPGGWIYSNAIGGMVFVPWTKTSKALEMRAALEAVKVWRGVGLDPLEHFEAIGEMFYKDTGFLRPGKSEPMECYSEGREEERRKFWEAWVIEKNQALNDRVAAALTLEGE
jgi:hypothetical protein